MILSILIPCLPDPASQNYLRRLRNILEPQIVGKEVDIIVNDLPRSVPTGTKRNLLIESTNAEYIVQIDCDDLVPMYYVNELLKAIEQKPDVITFIGHMTTDGSNKKDFVIKLNEKYEERKGVYYRHPNHLCCFKRELIKDIKFKAVWQQEDYLWATEVKNKRVLKTEVHINKDMYIYDYKTKPKPSVQSRRSQLR